MHRAAQAMAIIGLMLGIFVPLGRLAYLTVPELWKALVRGAKHLRKSGSLDDYLMAATALGWVLMLATVVVSMLEAW